MQLSRREINQRPGGIGGLAARMGCCASMDGLLASMEGRQEILRNYLDEP